MPQKKKSFRVLSSPKKPCQPPNRPSKRICWSNEAMLGAIDAVKKDGTGVNAAAAQFGVPPSTLRDQLSGRVVHGTRPGPAPYLEKDERNTVGRIPYFHL